jgi:hypothetical protein
VILLHSLARLNDRLQDAARDRGATARSLGSAIIRVSAGNQLAPAAADGGKGSFDQDADSREREDVLSLRLEIVDARPSRAVYVQATAAAREESIVDAPQPLELAPAWPAQQPSAALRYGTPEAYRAVAAYGAQRELQAPASRQDDSGSAPRLRMRA